GGSELGGRGGARGCPPGGGGGGGGAGGPGAGGGEPIEGTPALDLSEEVFPETQAPVAEADAEVAEPEAQPEAAEPEPEAEAEPVEVAAEVVETPGGEASQTAPADTGNLEEELVDESIEADAQSPDQPGPGDPEGEAPSAPEPQPGEGDATGRGRDHRGHRRREERSAAGLCAARCRDDLQRRHCPPPPPGGRGRSRGADPTFRHRHPRRRGQRRPSRDLAHRLRRPRGARLAGGTAASTGCGGISRLARGARRVAGSTRCLGDRGTAPLRGGRRGAFRRRRRDHGPRGRSAQALTCQQPRAARDPADRRRRESGASRLQLRERRHEAAARRFRRRDDAGSRGQTARVRRLAPLVGALALVAAGVGYAHFTEPGWWVRLWYPLKYQTIVRGHAENYNLDPALLAAVIYQESKFRANVKS